jgi:Family of unknown function (DUF6090)
MAEDEVIKHTKKIYKTWMNRDIPFWHKISEFLIEILIIVFAVTVSIWFHNLSEHRHEQEEVKYFLEGLKSDLTSDIVEMKDDKKSYIFQKTIFSYLSNLKINEPVNRDTLKKYGNWLQNTTGLNPNDGRFEGFKSSGKIGAIENKELQNDIMDLYQEDIPALLTSSRFYTNTKIKLFDFFIKNLKRITDSTSNMIILFKTDEGYNLCAALRSPDQIIGQYDDCIALMTKIIGKIDKQYHSESE